METHRFLTPPPDLHATSKDARHLLRTVLRCARCGETDLIRITHPTKEHQVTTTPSRRERAAEHMTRSARRTALRAAGGALLLSAAALVAGGPAAAAGPSVTVTPDSKLADSAFVNVSGTGFGTGGTVLIEQCAEVNAVTRCSDILAEVETNLNGAFSAVSLEVRAVFDSAIGAVECRTGCRINVWNATFPGAGQDGISFARYSSK